MTGPQLAEIRVSMGLDRASMAAVLGWPYRSYYARETGERGIGPEEARQVRDAHKRDRQTTAQAIQTVQALIARNHPEGIMSEISLDMPD